MITKQQIGHSLYLAGTIEEIEPLNYSLFNFNQDSGQLEIFELSDNFCYFVTTIKDFIKARSRNIHFNWKYQNPDGSPAKRYKRTKMARKLATLKAKKELDSYLEEHFIINQQKFTTHKYGFGHMPRDLDKTNSIYDQLEIRGGTIKENGIT